MNDAPVNKRQDCSSCGPYFEAVVVAGRVEFACCRCGAAFHAEEGVLHRSAARPEVPGPTGAGGGAQRVDASTDDGKRINAFQRRPLQRMVRLMQPIDIRRWGRTSRYLRRRGSSTGETDNLTRPPGND